ncbi:hypothetical protein VMCG_09988 [Cytospora schulzeri]|uniref:Uncharacterized protein n=1 Tax=Cytospora schulzeri TaxID=448051 RepID=A0A423VIT4_9PEZI|nr:hypothetical protein VMCG_09988 [Valsa malicola]
MSSVIAVCVSFIGLALVLINAVIFIQMILSFPAMLSSNSQTYIQQQRKYHHIPAPEDLDLSQLATSFPDGAEAETEFETEPEPEWVADEVVDRWIDDVDEQTNDCSSEVHHVSRQGTTTDLARGLEPITRGRPLRRQPRRHASRAVFRIKDDFDSRSRDPVDRTRPHCVKGWRSVEWTRRTLPTL